MNNFGIFDFLNKLSNLVDSDNFANITKNNNLENNKNEQSNKNAHINSEKIIYKNTQSSHPKKIYSQAELNAIVKRQQQLIENIKNNQQ